MIPACKIEPGRFVTAHLTGAAVLCLKVERHGRDYVNHYLIPLEPHGGRRALALVYIDPDHPLEPAPGVALEFGEASTAFPDIGDAFATPKGPHLKLRDEPKAQKVFAYVDLATGLIRPRMERQTQGVVAWRVISP
jgi:hypothetical protein